MTVYVTDVPGIDHKFELELELNGEERQIVSIHHDGKREVYLRLGVNQECQQLFSLTGKLARQLGSILEGAYFQPVEMDEIQIPLVKRSSNGSTLIHRHRWLGNHSRQLTFANRQAFPLSLFSGARRRSRIRSQTRPSRPTTCS